MTMCFTDFPILSANRAQKKNPERKPDAQKKILSANLGRYSEISPQIEIVDPTPTAAFPCPPRLPERRRLPRHQASPRLRPQALPPLPRHAPERFGVRWPPSRLFLAALLVLLTGETRNLLRVLGMSLLGIFLSLICE